MGGAARVGADSILNHPAKEAPIDTVVVLMMENRSVDHHLGWLATDDDYLEAGRRRYGARFGFNGDNTQTYVDPTGEMVDTWYLPGDADEPNPHRRCGAHPDPGHGWESGRAQRDHGFLAEGSGNDEFALGYYEAADVAVYADLARRFTVFDRYHCSLLASTYPNRSYLHSAQAGGLKNNTVPSSGYTWPTIWDKLAAAGVPIGYYFIDLPVTALWAQRQAGFRVPTIMASPYAQPGFVDHNLYDHTSILRFIEWRFLGAPPTGPGADGDSWYLTARDRHANNIGASLVTAGDPSVEVDAVPPVPVASAPCMKDDPGGLAAVAAERKHQFELDYEAGVFERLGWNLDYSTRTGIPVT